MSEKNNIEENVERCLHLLIEGKLAEAKVISENLEGNDNSNVDGIVAAINGIRNALGQKASQADLLKQGRVKLIRALQERSNTIWGDSFDDAYFRVWLKFLKLFEEMKLKVESEGVMKNPSEEK